MQWTILEKLWKRTLYPLEFSASDNTQTWNEEIKSLYQLGIGMEDTLQFLYFEKPDFNTFKSWINNQTKNENTASDFTDNVLSEEDLQFWDKSGYVIVKNAISKKIAKRHNKPLPLW